MTGQDAFRFTPEPTSPESPGIIAILIGLLHDGAGARVPIDGGAIIKLSEANLDAEQSPAKFEIEDFAGFMGEVRGPAGDAPAVFDPDAFAAGDPNGGDDFAWL